MCFIQNQKFYFYLGILKIHFYNNIKIQFLAFLHKLENSDLDLKNMLKTWFLNPYTLRILKCTNMKFHVFLIIF